MADEPADRDQARQDSVRARKDKTFKAVMLGLMAGSAVFLAGRYLLKIDVEAALVVATFVAVGIAVFMLRTGDVT